MDDGGPAGSSRPGGRSVIIYLHREFVSMAISLFYGESRRRARDSIVRSFSGWCQTSLLALLSISTLISLLIIMGGHGNNLHDAPSGCEAGMILIIDSTAARGEDMYEAHRW